MYNLTETEQADTSNGQSTAKNQNNENSSEQIIIRDTHKGLPIVGLPEGWFAALGTKRLTDYFKTKEELIKHIDERPFELVVTLSAAVAEEIIHIKQ